MRYTNQLIKTLGSRQTFGYHVGPGRLAIAPIRRNCSRANSVIGTVATLEHQDVLRIERLRLGPDQLVV